MLRAFAREAPANAGRQHNTRHAIMTCTLLHRNIAHLECLSAAVKLPAQASNKPAAPKPSDPNKPRSLDASKPKPSDPAKKSSAAVNGQKLARADGRTGSMQKAQPSKPPELAKAKPAERPAVNGVNKRVMDSSSDSVSYLEYMYSLLLVYTSPSCKEARIADVGALAHSAWHTSFLVDCFQLFKNPAGRGLPSCHMMSYFARSCWPRSLCQIAHYCHIRCKSTCRDFAD